MTGPAAEAAVAIGDRVYYSGSLEHRWGRYRLAAVVETDFDGTRYELATYDGEIALENVRRESFRSIEGPMHRVTALQTRLIAVERMALEKYGEVPDYLVFSMRCVPVVIERGRPAEAEHYLLSLEVSVGCISQDYFQDAASKVQILGDDNSWSTNWTQAELDELRRQYHPSWKKE